MRAGQALWLSGPGLPAEAVAKAGFPFKAHPRIPKHRDHRTSGFPLRSLAENLRIRTIHKKTHISYMKDIPPLLFKYRDWDNNHHKKCLTDTEIFFSPPASFNDPFDCSIPFRYEEKDLTEDKISI
jgi:hypothetical protein